jgi:hypothetical protein
LYFAIVIAILTSARFCIALYLESRFNATFSKSINILLLPPSVIFAFVALSAAFVAYRAYKFSIEKIYEWGALVKAAFDCYLPELAKRLGYKLPLTGDEQRRFWVAVSRRAIYHLPLKPEEWLRADDSNSPQEHDEISSDQSQENVSEADEENVDA